MSRRPGTKTSNPVLGLVVTALQDYIRAQLKLHSPSIAISKVIMVCGRYGGDEKYFFTGRAVNMAGMVDLELVDLIRNFLSHRGHQGTTINDLRREMDRNFGTVYDALIYMQEEGKVHYKQQTGDITWYFIITGQRVNQSHR